MQEKGSDRESKGVLESWPLSCHTALLWTPQALTPPGCLDPGLFRSAAGGAALLDLRMLGQNRLWPRQAGLCDSCKSGTFLCHFSEAFRGHAQAF